MIQNFATVKKKKLKIVEIEKVVGASEQKDFFGDSGLVSNCMHRETNVAPREAC
jgi:hypothetical protein